MLREEQDRQDAALNAAYKELLALLPRSEREGLRVIQRNWWRAREGSKDFMAQGGSMYLRDSAYWGMAFTRERVHWMQRQIERLRYSL
jgi:uncharacterized protein YecT (DUF1311 family)